MAVLCISYDLVENEGPHYSALIAAIKNVPYCHVVESTWLIDTTSSPKEVVEELTKYLNPDDEVIVLVVQPGIWWSHGLSLAKRTWLNYWLSGIGNPPPNVD